MSGSTIAIRRPAPRSAPAHVARATMSSAASATPSRFEASAAVDDLLLRHPPRGALQERTIDQRGEQQRGDQPRPEAERLRIEETEQRQRGATVKQREQRPPLAALDRPPPQRSAQRGEPPFGLGPPFGVHPHHTRGVCIDPLLQRGDLLLSVHRGYSSTQLEKRP